MVTILKCALNFVKFRDVVFEICERTDRQTDRRRRSNKASVPAAVVVAAAGEVQRFVSSYCVTPGVA